MRALPLLALACCALGGCRTDGSSPTSSNGSFSANWVGSDTGKLSAAPRAAFCTEGNHLEILATKGDLGIGLAIYPGEKLEDGSFEAFDPSVDSISRPGVAAAARWFTEREIAAYQSDWGSLKLKKRGQVLSGGFAMHLRKVGVDSDTIVLNGHFSGVVPGPCVPDTVSQADTTE